MNSKVTKKTKLITKNNNNNATNNHKFLMCCSQPPGTPLVAVNMNNGHGSVRPVKRLTEKFKEPVLKYVTVGKKQGGVLPMTVPGAVASSKGGDENDDKEEKDGQRKKKGGGKKILRVVKAIFFETSLGKKLKTRKLKKKLKKGSQGKLPIQPEKSFSENSIYQESEDYENGRIFSPTSSSLGSSSRIASSSTCSSSLSSLSNSKYFSDRNKSSFRLGSSERTLQKQKQDNMQEQGKGYNVQGPGKEFNWQEHGKGYYGPTIGCCFLLISLFVLVFWGKICAILCTSIWLFSVPRWINCKNSSENLAINIPKLDSDYRKKIIIEGLVERNHSRHR